MRVPVLLLLAALAGILGGGALIGTAALGACLIFDSLAVAGCAVLFMDLPEPKRRPVAEAVPLAEYLERKAAERW